jgi:cytochrome c oxidase subunit 2
MNKVFLTIIVLVIVVAGGVFFMQKQKATQTPVPQPTTAMTKEQPTTAPKEANGEVKEFNVEGGMFYFKPNELKVKKGQKVKITFTNKEGVHDFVIDDFNVQSKRIDAGQTDVVEFTPDKTGNFEFYCSVGNHRQMGMKGTLIVE